MIPRLGRIWGPRIWGNIGLGAGQTITAPGGFIGALTGNMIGNSYGLSNSGGSIFFVDIFNGANTNSGLTPALAFQTIAYALTQCTDDYDDYIIVLDAWNEATPIAINKTRVHIIGLSSNPARPYPVLTATGDTAIFVISSNSNNCEIAGLDFGGGASHAAIENVAGTPMGVAIHHCTFGHTWAGDTPLYGIWIAANATAILIEKCHFKGTGGDAEGTITADGIRFAGAGNTLGGEIRDNIFQGCPGIGLNIVTGNGMLIRNNDFALDANTAGAGITLGATCDGALVSRNNANFSKADMGLNPWVDGGSNSWVANMRGDDFLHPA